jgi:hypothetical protein
MKITRRQLRQLIETTLSEQNPGSHFAAAETKGKETSEKEIKAKWSKRIQKTYDWFMSEVFPAIEAGKKHIKSPEKWLVFGITRGDGNTQDIELTKQPGKDMEIHAIKPGTKVPLPGAESNILSIYIRGGRNTTWNMTIDGVWKQLEKIGANADINLDVQMTSDAGEALDSMS